MLRRSFLTVPTIAALCVATAVSVAIPQVAGAGTVDVRSCGDAPSGGLDNAWVYESDSALRFEQGPRVCPPNGVPAASDPDHPQIPGLTAWTKRNSGGSATAGQAVEWRFTAPTGTTISRVQIKRDIGIRSDGYYVYGRTDGGQLTGETCTRAAGQFTCNRGAYGDSGADFPGLSAAWISWGFECGANGFGTCSTGATLLEAWAYIYASTVTLTDNQAPSVPTVAGAVTTAGWKGGTVAATATASDNLGIQTIRWYSDGTLVAGSSTTRTCDFTTPVPCSDVAAAATSLNTTALADGTRSIQLAVLDPAGNETKSVAFNVDIDNAPPAAPTGLIVAGGGLSPDFAMSWTNPANPAGAPLSSASWRACRQGGGGCVTGSGTLSGATGSASGSLPAVGTYDLSVWLVDSAGNGAQSNSATATVTYTAPAPSAGGGGGGGGGGGTAPERAGTPADPFAPTEPPSPTLPLAPQHPATPPSQQRPPATPRLKLSTATISPKTGRLVVRGTITRRARGSLTITVRFNVGARSRTHTAKARISHGHYRAALPLPKTWRHAKRATVTVRYRGSRTVRAARITRRVTRARKEATPHPARDASVTR